MDYRKLKHKLFFHMLLVTIASILLAFLLRFIGRGQIGNFIVSLLENIFFLDFTHAQTIYQLVIRNNLEYFLIAAVVIFFLLFFRILIRLFTNYFDEVNAGIDALIDAKKEDIILSPEMDFMETKLNTLKQTLEQRENEAKQAEQKKNDLVMYLAHDIKTPLTSVIGYLSLLDEALDMPIEQRGKYVHITLDKAYRLEELINEFFEIARYNLQTITLVKENIDLHYMLVQMLDEAYPQLSIHGQQTKLIAPDDVIIYGDGNKLARVFNNILKNAIAYSEEKSIITITAQVKQNCIRIEFQNVGTIPKDKLTTIFEKFYRLDEARGSGTGGSGLGLAIAKEIVTLHGGNIYAKSEKGSTVFTVELPIAKGEKE